MDDFPTSAAAWVAAVSGSQVADARRLRRYGCTWALRVDERDVVLKYGPAVDWRDAYACEVAALGIARKHRLPVPEVLGVDLDARGDDPVALLLTWLPGTSAVPRDASIERLRGVGRLAGALHQIQMEPSAELPFRTRHTSWTDFALWRRLASRYRSVETSAQQEVVSDAMAELGSPREPTEELLRTTVPNELLEDADARLQAATPPTEATVFVHGDLWQGNTLWDGDRCVGLIDWETAGVGHPGVDLGCLRWDAAVLFGPSAPGHISAGWAETTRRQPEDEAYWDVVAALNVPADVERLVPSFHEAGRTDLDGPTVRQRHYAFVQDAVDRLG